MVAFVSLRRIKGSVPGNAPILSVAVVEESYLVATDEGVLVTKNLDEWTPLFGDVKTRSHVSMIEGQAVIRYEKGDRRFVARTFHLPDFDTVADKGPLGTAFSAGQSGVSFVGLSEQKKGRIVAIGSEGVVEEVAIDGVAPREITALQVVPGEAAKIYAGGLTSGLWVASGFPDAASWVKLISTPIRAILTDPGDPSVLLIGTQGGVLLSASEGRTWRFTQMRIPVEALATYDGSVYAVTGERVLYRSDDGDTGWKPLGGAISN